MVSRLLARARSVFRKEDLFRVCLPSLRKQSLLLLLLVVVVVVVVQLLRLLLLLLKLAGHHHRRGHHCVLPTFHQQHAR